MPKLPHTDMSIILLADDSPHAQRMGERILREEGYEVVSLTDGNTAALRMADVDPDLVIADAFLPGMNGFDLCRYAKTRHPHVRVILTAGLLEILDEKEARLIGCDAILKKPFEASVVTQTIRPLVQEAQLARGLFAEAMTTATTRAGLRRSASTAPGCTSRPRTRARRHHTGSGSIASAIDPEITEKVLVALGH